MLSVIVSNRHGTHTIYYIKLVKYAFCKKHEKLLIMQTKTFETKEQKTQSVHTFEVDENGYPFAILETSVVNEDNTESTFEVILGNSKVNEKKFSRIQECIDYIKNKPWDLIYALIAHTIEIHHQWQTNQQILQSQQKSQNNEETH